MHERLSYKITEKLFSELPDDYHLRAQERLRQGNFVEAIEDFDKVMEFKPRDYKTLMERGCAKYEIKDAIGAIQDLTNSIELSPYHYLFLYNVGVNKLIHADINGALKDYDKSILLNPSFFQSYYNRGYVNFCLGNINSAIDDFTKTIELKTKCFQAYINRGSAKYKLQDFQGAIRDFDIGFSIAYEYYASETIFNLKSSNNEFNEYFNAIVKINEYYISYTCFSDSRTFKITNLVDYFEPKSEADTNLLNSLFYRGLSKRDIYDYIGALDDLERTIELTGSCYVPVSSFSDLELKILDEIEKTKNFLNSL